jgi:DNA-binding transcriptional MerR regulator
VPCTTACGGVTGGSRSERGPVARRLGIPPSTLRAWNRRYGIGPADHQAGRHRHYTERDIAALETMCRLIGQGVLPAAAAAIATARRKPEPEVVEPISVPATASHRRSVRGLVAAAMRLDDAESVHDPT